MVYYGAAAVKRNNTAASERVRQNMQILIFIKLAFSKVIEHCTETKDIKRF